MHRAYDIACFPYHTYLCNGNDPEPDTVQQEEAGDQTSVAQAPALMDAYVYIPEPMRSSSTPWDALNI